MKSPFRSIRQSLFSEGKLLRYIGYAIGEIALIIIGILFALKINNMNEDRKAQVEFDEYIVQLREDVKEAIENIDLRLVRDKERVPERLMLLKVIESQNLQLKDFEDFEGALSRLGRSPTAEVHIGFFGDLLNGEMDAVINDRDLVRQVMEISKQVKGRLAIIQGHTRRANLAEETFIKSFGNTHSTIPELKMRYNLERLRTSPDFLNALQNTITATQIKNIQTSDLKESLESFLAVLEEYE